MMLVIHTQYSENYGAHDWDGTGECPQYWKMKGGSEFKILGVPDGLRGHEVQAIVSRVRNRVETNTHYSRETIMDWQLKDDDYLSWFERSQLEFDGAIIHKEPEIRYEDI